MCARCGSLIYFTYDGWLVCAVCGNTWEDE
jgi:uncharacterized Zn finger protein (UPF0148 family)